MHRILITIFGTLAVLAIVIIVSQDDEKDIVPARPATTVTATATPTTASQFGPVQPVTPSTPTYIVEEFGPFLLEIDPRTNNVIGYSCVSPDQLVVLMIVPFSWNIPVQGGSVTGFRTGVCADKAFALAVQAGLGKIIDNVKLRESEIPVGKSAADVESKFQQLFRDEAAKLQATGEISLYYEHAHGSMLQMMGGPRIGIN